MSKTMHHSVDGITDEFTYAGVSVSIESQGSHPDYNPREVEEGSIMLCWHPNYELGDQQVTPCDALTIMQVCDEVIARYHSSVILPIWAPDTYSLDIRAGANVRHELEDFGNDLTRIEVPLVAGVIVDIPPGRPVISNDLIEQGLREQVADYSTWLRGECFTVRVAEGTSLEKWEGGVLGYERAREVGIELAEEVAIARPES